MVQKNMNEKQKEELLATAFAACLDDMETRGASLEDCLARHPELRDDLEPALLTVSTIEAVPQWHVSPEFKATAPQRIVRKIRQRQSRPTLRSRLSGLNPLGWISNAGFAPVAVRVAIVVLAGLLIVTGGTAIAASDTQPDNPLHQVKLATENIELLLRPAGEARTTLLIEILDRRASELLTMSWQNKPDAAQKALVYYQAALQVGHKMLAGYNPANSTDAVSAVQWQEALARNLAVMQGLVDAMKAPVQPVLRTAISNTQDEQTWVNGLLVKTPQSANDATPTTGAQGAPTPGQCVYAVKKGDTLSNIAQGHNTTWQRLAAINNIPSPDSIYIGQQIVVPCSTTPGDGQMTPPAEFKLCQYTVKSGDTLSSIAQIYNTTTRLLIAVNNVPSADRIFAGQRIVVPCYVK